jgi:Tfp pilus assembly protein PilF
MLHARQGRLASAEKALRRALEIDADSAEANFNLGLLLVEQGKPTPAMSHLEAAFAVDPTMAPAAYNLAVLAATEDPRAAVGWSRKAYELQPDLPKYVQTYVFYLWQTGEIEPAAVVLERTLERGAISADTVRMLAQIYAKQGREADLKALYARAAEDPRLPLEARRLFGRDTEMP